MKGCKPGPGNPFAARVHELRRTLLDAITPDALHRVVIRMIELAVEGDVAAAKVVIERAVGKPIEPDLVERIERIESMLEGGNE